MFAASKTAGAVSAEVNYIEDVFSTYLYTGTNATNTITNGIDLSTKGGMVWIKNRQGGFFNLVFDTVRGANKWVYTNDTAAQSTGTDLLNTFNTTGFTLGSDSSGYGVNSGGPTVAWTFRKQPKFFDVVTYTGNGASSRDISHNLQVTPAFIIVKCTSNTTDWAARHVQTSMLLLNTADAANASATFANGSISISLSTPSTFRVLLAGGSTLDNVNTSGYTYVAYLFASNEGGFGLTGTDNVISCGSFTSTSGGAASVTLGYEPQWLLIKRSSGADNWYLIDNMRGYSYSQTASLAPNSSAAEDPAAFIANPTATGFEFGTGTLFNSSTYIYIAIRRGPMKVPTDATTVYQATTYSGNGTNNRSISTNFPVDMFLDLRRNGVQDKYALDRLRGNLQLWTNLTTSESANTAQVPANSFNANQTGVLVSADELNTSTRTYVLDAFKRAPSFFDEVCYTGTGSARTQAHNLGVVPQLIIVKVRNDTESWTVYSEATGNTKILNLDKTNAQATGTQWNNTTPTSSVFSLGTSNSINGSGLNYVAYLFATCAGVSKVGSYTGNGTTQTINCGFTGGARFVLIKRTDSTGDWYVYDTARGMTTLVDPYLLLNSTAAESATLGSVTTVSTGFAVNASILAAINTNGASYIFLAIA